MWILNTFARVLCNNTSRVAEGEHSCLQEQLPEQENLYLKNQNLQQQSLEVLRLTLFHKICLIIKNLIARRDLKDLPVTGRLKHFHMNWENLISDPKSSSGL